MEAEYLRKAIVEICHRYGKKPLASLGYGSVSEARDFMDFIENIGNPLLSARVKIVEMCKEGFE